MINHVTSGQPLQIKADDFNLIADVANAYAASGQEATLKEGASQRSAYDAGPQIAHVRLHNGCQQGRAVRLIQPAENVRSALTWRGDGVPPVLDGDTAFTTGTEPYGIALHDCGPGEVAEVCVSGICMVYIGGNDASGSDQHKCCTPTPGTTTGELRPAYWGRVQTLDASAYAPKRWHVAIVTPWRTMATQNGDVYAINANQQIYSQDGYTPGVNYGDADRTDGVSISFSTVYRDGDGNWWSQPITFRWPRDIAPVIEVDGYRRALIVSADCCG